MATDALHRKEPAARPWLVALSLWLALAAVAALALWHLRHEAVGSQGRELSLLSLASTDAIERGLRGAEEGLHAMRAELEEGACRWRATRPLGPCRHVPGSCPWCKRSGCWTPTVA